jgi:hypothetical protein
MCLSRQASEPPRLVFQVHGERLLHSTPTELGTSNPDSTNIQLLRSWEPPSPRLLQTFNSYGVANLLVPDFYKHSTPAELGTSNPRLLQTFNSYGVGTSNPRLLQTFNSYGVANL